MVEHYDLVMVAKSFGLFYLIAMAAAVLAYVFWPRNKSKFTAAGKSIFTDEDRP